MLSNSYDNKENIMDEVLVATPVRKPLTTLQVAAQSTVSDSTPSNFHRKTPRHSGQLSTPCSKKPSNRKASRKSMPLRLSKVGSVFEEESLTHKIPYVSQRLLESKDALTFEKDGVQGQALNEMLREKIFETVSKMKEKYEVFLAEKEKCLEQKSVMIAQLKTEVNMLKNISYGSQNPDTNHNIDDNQEPNLENNKKIDNHISEFVEQILTKVVQDLSDYKSNDLTASVPTTQTPFGNPGKLVDAQTWMSPVKQVDSTTGMTPVKYSHSQTSTMCTEQIESGSQVTPVKQVSSETMMTPVKTMNTDTEMTPKRSEQLTQTMELQFADISSSGFGQQSPITSRYSLDADPRSFLRRNSLKIHTMSIQTDMATAMTPVEKVDGNTMVTPKQTLDKAAFTSPLMAALQPEIINSLPIEMLRAELESAAISNELLRAECEHLNSKVMNLETDLQETKVLAGENVKVLEEKVDYFQSELEKALEVNRAMELKKPHSVEEFEDVISKLQKDILQKEKQIAFYCKKASETDNLQKDLRRMYAKYNAEHECYTKLEKEMKGLTEQHDLKCTEHETTTTELCDLKKELNEAKAKIEAQIKLTGEARRTQVKCSQLEEQMDAFQSQQKENMDFMEQERKGLEETATELEHVVKERTAELDATRQALEIKTEQHENLRETTHSLRTQLNDVQDELNSVQSQAYLLMLSQEKELTTLSRVLEEAWVRISAMVDSYKKQGCKEGEDYQICEVDDNVKTNEATVNYKPSLVHQVLAAVSGTTKQVDTIESTEGKEQAQQQQEEEEDAALETTHSKGDQNLTSMERTMSFTQLLEELEEYASIEAVNEHSQMMIQQYVDEIANLKDALDERKQVYEKKIENLKECLDNENVSVKKMQRENEAKEVQMERLKLDLQNVEENFRVSRKRIDEMSESYCQLIEQETKNEELNGNLRLAQRDYEKLKVEKSNLEKNLQETMEKLKESMAMNEQCDVDERKVKAQQSFTELLGKKLKLQREVDKLRESYSKSCSEREKYAQYSSRLETKVNFLASNVNKAEDEIYRLDGVVDRFCSIARANREMAIHSKDLCELLAELNITME